jgi:GH25 family lysozyme M1 (1,4-beta-N-acetylmuramidase)
MLGIDVFGKYQGAINWADAFQSGVRAAFIKLTNGSLKASPTGDVYVDGAHGVKILAGGYAYALGSSTPVAQAITFAAELKRLNALDLAPALDFEDASLPTSQAARRSWIVQFFTELKKQITWLSKVLIYSSGSELLAIAAGSLKNAVPGLVILVWDAEYGPNDGSEHPVTHYTGTSAIHQYTSVGVIKGVPTEVDKDDIETDVTEPHPGTVTPTEDDMVPNDLLNTNITYKSRVDGTTKTVKFVDAVADGASMHEQYAKGYGGVGSAGPMGLEIATTYTTVNNLSTALKAMSDLVAAGSTSMTATDVYNAVTRALQENTVQVDVNVQGSTPPATT